MNFVTQQDEHRRMSMCSGKEQYPTPQLAHRVSRRRNGKGKHVDVYKCPYCHCWHQGGHNRNPRR